MLEDILQTTGELLAVWLWRCHFEDVMYLNISRNQMNILSESRITIYLSLSLLVSMSSSGIHQHAVGEEEH